MTARLAEGVDAAVAADVLAHVEALARGDQDAAQAHAPRTPDDAVLHLAYAVRVLAAAVRGGMVALDVVEGEPPTAEEDGTVEGTPSASALYRAALGAHLDALAEAQKRPPADLPPRGRLVRIPTVGPGGLDVETSVTVNAARSNLR